MDDVVIRCMLLWFHGHSMSASGWDSTDILRKQIGKWAPFHIHSSVIMRATRSIILLIFF